MPPTGARRARRRPSSSQSPQNSPIYRHIYRNTADTKRSVTQEQLEYAHDSGSYRPPPAPPRPGPAPIGAKPDTTESSQQSSLPPVIFTSFDQKRAERHEQRIENARSIPRDGKPFQAGHVPQIPVQRLDAIEEIPDLVDLGFIDPDEPLAASAAPTWLVYRPVTRGQRQRAEFLAYSEDSPFLRALLFEVMRQGLPPRDLYEEFMSQYADSGLFEEEGQRAVELLDMVRYSPFDALSEKSDDLPGFNWRTAEDLETDRPDESFKKTEDFIRYVEIQSAELVPELSDLPWDSMNKRDAAMFYYAALSAKFEELAHPYDPNLAGSRAPMLRRIDDELQFVWGLLQNMVETPLEDFDTMQAAYGWKYKSDGVFYFRRRLEAIFEDLGVTLPNSWEAINTDPVLMGHVFVDIFPEVEARVSGELLQKLFVERSLYEDFAILTGTYQPVDLTPVVTALTWLFPKLRLPVAMAQIASSFVQEGGEAVAKDVAEIAIEKGLKRALPYEPIVDFGFSMHGHISSFTEIAESLPSHGERYNQAEFAEAFLKELYAASQENNEILEGWTDDELHGFFLLLNPERGEVTGDTVLAALVMAFRPKIREQQQNP